MEKKKVAYLGRQPVTFGYMATEKFFSDKDRYEFVGCHNHRQVCKTLLRNDVDFGVVAIENRIDKMVPEAGRDIVEALLEGGLNIYGEVTVPIKHYLLSCSESLGQIQKIMSHPSAIRQCSKEISNIKLTYDEIITKDSESTGAAAKLASEDQSIAAIASKLAETHYELNRLVEYSIEDYPDNQTRFLILAREEHPPKTGNDKTCFLLRLPKNDPTGVWRVLAPFVQELPPHYLVNPFRFVRMDRENLVWEDYWLVELGGHIEDDTLQEIHTLLVESGNKPQFVSSYPINSEPF
jgi:chorismate mutase / prephenate dehydratase